MGASSSKAAKLKSWEHPLKSGIWISEVINRSDGASYGVSYRVSIPAKLAGVRKRQNFAKKLDAEDFAERENETIRKHGQDFLSITPAERREIASAVELLRPAGIGIMEAASFALKHMRPAGGEKTINQLTDEMIAMKRSWLEKNVIRERSFRDFRTRATKFAEIFGSQPVKGVTLEEIKVWLKSFGLRSRSVKNYRMVVGELLKYAKQKSYRADNPMEGFTREDKHEIEPGGDDQREPSILSVTEAERLLRTAYAHPELDLGAAITLALFCGIRTEEIKRMDWAAVRLGEQPSFVKIGREIAKKRRIRNVEIPANAQAWLSTWPNRIGRVAKNTYVTDYVKRFAKLTKLAGFGRKDENGEWVSTWDDNCMRHSFGSYMYSKTGDSMLTSGLLGHKANDQVLFDHYRSLTTKADAVKYFSISPPIELKSNVISIHVA